MDAAANRNLTAGITRQKWPFVRTGDCLSISSLTAMLDEVRNDV
jgi:hypothetical protein